MNGDRSVKGKAAQSFEDLYIYQRACELTNAVYTLSRDGTFARDRGLVDQIRRAAVSIMSNVAEGFERGASTEFVQYLFISKGSCGEVRAQLQVAADQQYITAEDHVRLVDLCRRLSAMISNFVAHLQSSDYRGEKFSRPQRAALEAFQRRQDELIAAQQARMRASSQTEPRPTPPEEAQSGQ